MDSANFVWANRTANNIVDRGGDISPALNLARAYLSLLEAVEPLLAAPMTPRKERETYDEIARRNSEFILAARNTAAALRDLLGPTGGQA